MTRWPPAHWPPTPSRSRQSSAHRCGHRSGGGATGRQPSPRCTATPGDGSRTYSKLDGRHLLEAWLPLLALYAHQPRTEWTALHRAEKAGASRWRRCGWPEAPAVDSAEELVALYDAGLPEPLPIPLKTPYAYGRGPALPGRSRERRPICVGAQIVILARNTSPRMIRHQEWRLLGDAAATAGR